MKPAIPEISKGNEGNLKTLQKASSNDDLALVVCYDRQTDTFVDAICAINHVPAEDGKGYSFVPLALMNKGSSLYDRLIPCTQAEDIEATIKEAKNPGSDPNLSRMWLEAVVRINFLEEHLIQLAQGVRSKRDLLLSGTPTSKYVNVPDLLKAIADEAEAVINEV